MPRPPLRSRDLALYARRRLLPRATGRGYAFAGLITSVHAAMIDVIPRISLFLKQARQKGFVGFGGTAPAPGTQAAPGPDTRLAAQNGGIHPLEQGPGFVHAVSCDAIGRVIGPGGSQIREIRDKTGARVRVGNDKIPGTQVGA